jgi:hypothetical protein
MIKKKNENIDFILYSSVIRMQVMSHNPRSNSHIAMKVIAQRSKTSI